MSEAIAVPPAPTPFPWWDHAVVYQVYIRSFADANGDGIGDLEGLRSRLDYLAQLGVDALWLNPCYASPQRDHGYDITDYFAIDPDYGTVADLERLVADAGARGIRIIMDMVANHCSSDHAWFQAALASAPGSAERARFHFGNGKGQAGDKPPTNYESVFGGPAWTRVTEADGTPGQWYLHVFDSSQPDLNWSHPDVIDHFDKVLDFWFERGVAGFRIDVGHGMAKASDLTDIFPGATSHPAWDQPEVHTIYRRWRQLGDGHSQGPRYFVGEVWVTEEALARYLAPDELHQVFSFDLLVQPWDSLRHREAIERSLALVPGSLPAWTLSNHDVHRTVTRYGQEQDLSPADPSDMIGAARRHAPSDDELGRRRARAAALLELALPGSVYLYQGEELGLPEVLDLPDEVRQDPIWHRSGGAVKGRDGCRVPMPWSVDGATLGFSPVSSGAESAVQPWLPQPPEYAELAADGQLADPSSMWHFFRRAIAARSQWCDPRQPLVWVDEGPPGVLIFTRGALWCAINYTDADVELLLPGELVLASETSDVLGILPSNSAMWRLLSPV